MDALENGWNQFVEVTLEWLPVLVGALVILIIGWIIAGLIKSGIRKLLSSMGLNDRLYSGHGGNIIQKAVPDPEGLVASIGFWAVMLGAISLAVSVLGIDALTAFVGAIYSYLPNVLAALAIFLVAGAIATAVAAFAGRTLGDTATGKLVATVVPVIVMGIATFMILDQLMIAETIITITYAALMGAAALGLALAFGLGGRDVAARMLEGAYQKGVEQSGQIKRDASVAKQRTQDSARGAANRTRRR
jgi:hypothetical protein